LKAFDVTYSTEELFAQIARGNEAAFALAFHHYNKRIYPYLMRKVQSEAIAQEMVQDVFLRLWVFREKLDAAHNPESYLFNIAANILQDYYRRLGRELRMKSGWTKKEEGHQTIEADVWQSETRKLLNEAVEELPTERRRVYRLRMEGFSYEEIAGNLGISVHTVRNQLATATKTLKDILHSKGLSALIAIIFWEELKH
jgi:RNA polymerase sigma-70 factor (ECF subfamily)